MDARRYSPAAQRNAEPLADALAAALPAEGTVLEIASGSGEHALFFARRFPHLRWQPSDIDAEALASIAAYRDEAALENVASPVRIDVSDPRWFADLASPSAILVVNMVHIAPWEATLGLFAGAQKLLRAGSPIFLYGPFIEAGVSTAPSNLAFDASLRARHAAWGVRTLEAVVAAAAAAQHDFRLEKRTAMPANNLTLQFSKHRGQ